MVEGKHDIRRPTVADVNVQIGDKVIAVEADSKLHKELMKIQKAQDEAEFAEVRDSVTAEIADAYSVDSDNPATEGMSWIVSRDGVECVETAKIKILKKAVGS